MTGKDWDTYFKTLTRARKEELRQALTTLIDDPMFCRHYGRDFRELAAILDFKRLREPYPLSLTY